MPEGDPGGSHMAPSEIRKIDDSLKTIIENLNEIIEISDPNSIPFKRALFSKVVALRARSEIMSGVRSLYPGPVAPPASRYIPATIIDTEVKKILVPLRRKSRISRAKRAAIAEDPEFDLKTTINKIRELKLEQD